MRLLTEKQRKLLSRLLRVAGDPMILEEALIKADQDAERAGKKDPDLETVIRHILLIQKQREQQVPRTP